MLGRAFASALPPLCLAWLWFWSTFLATALFGRPLESAFPSLPAQSAPAADAIVLLGGGMASCNGETEYAEMRSAADRAWHAARLYRAGKAPVVVCTGKNTPLSTAPLLEDLGVPANAIRCIENPRNTEEEGREVAAALGQSSGQRPRRILLVTSAWHMRRSLLLFRKAVGADVEVCPSAADYEGTALLCEGFEAKWLWPSADVLAYNSAVFKEHYAYWAYRLLRGF